MDLKVWMYLAYLAISIGLTMWVARALSRNGLVFLADVFRDERLAAAVNSLLVVGFYLLNLGYVAVAMRSGGAVASPADALEDLSLKIGLVLLVLGALHFFNVYALSRYRRGRLRREAIHPPVPPVGRLPMPPVGGTPAPPVGGTPVPPVPPVPGYPPQVPPPAPA